MKIPTPSDREQCRREQCRQVLWDLYVYQQTYPSLPWQWDRIIVDVYPLCAQCIFLRRFNEVHWAISSMSLHLK